MKPLRHHNFLTAIQEHALRALLYSDIFRYPLTADEVHHFLGVGGVDKKSVDVSLASMRDAGLIYQFDKFFSPTDDASLADRRIKGNVAAEKILPLARRKANLISKFPFVRGVLASGSLSKGFIDEKSDIDFFVITLPNRLWIARTLLVLYKRVFYFNSHKYFCVNYFVDEEHLEIEEKNHFTATELATVIPLYGCSQYISLHRSNGWLKNFFPNFHLRSIEGVPTSTSGWLKNLLEKLLSKRLGDALERFCHQRTLSRWKRLYGVSHSSNDFDIAFKSKSYASKNHPSNFQRVVIEAYENKLNAFGLTNGTHAGEGLHLIQNDLFMWQSSGSA